MLLVHHADIHQVVPLGQGRQVCHPHLGVRQQLEHLESPLGAPTSAGDHEDEWQDHRVDALGSQVLPYSPDFTVGLVKVFVSVGQCNFQELVAKAASNESPPKSAEDVDGASHPRKPAKGYKPLPLLIFN